MTPRQLNPIVVRNPKRQDTNRFSEDLRTINIKNVVNPDVTILPARMRQKLYINVTLFKYHKQTCKENKLLIE